jgi:transposase-like protein
VSSTSSSAENTELLPTTSKEDADTIAEQDAAFLALTTKQQRFIHLYITGQYTVQKLAQLLEVHPNTLFAWLRRSDVKGVIADLQLSTQDIVTTQIKALTMKAANKLNSLIDSPIDGVALQAVKDVLDRSGHKAKQEIKVDKTITTIEQKLNELIDKTIIDGEYEVIE